MNPMLCQLTSSETFIPSAYGLKIMLMSDLIRAEEVHHMNSDDVRIVTVMLLPLLWKWKAFGAQSEMNLDGTVPFVSVCLLTVSCLPAAVFSFCQCDISDSA